MDKVSIIIPVFNVVEYVDACISSAVAQSYSNIEIIIVDDESTDGSVQICDDWAVKDERIQVIHHKHVGVSNARNVGIDLAVGEWLVFLDGDDQLDKTFVEIMLSKAREMDVQIVMCGYKYVSKHTTTYHFFSEDQEFTANDREELQLMALGLKNVHSCNASIGSPAFKLYKTAFIKNNGLRFDTSLKKMQDVIFNLYCFEKLEKAYYYDLPLYRYVHRSSSTVHRYSPNHIECVERSIEALDKFFDMTLNVSRKKEAYNAKMMGLFLEVMKLELIRKECPMSLKEKIVYIRKLSDKPYFRNAIENVNNIYLNSKMHFLQKILKYRLNLLAYLLCYVKYHKQYL